MQCIDLLDGHAVVKRMTSHENTDRRRRARWLDDDASMIYRRRHVTFHRLMAADAAFGDDADKRADGNR